MRQLLFIVIILFSTLFGFASETNTVVLNSVNSEERISEGFHSDSESFENLNFDSLHTDFRNFLDIPFDKKKKDKKKKKKGKGKPLKYQCKYSV